MAQPKRAEERRRDNSVSDRRRSVSAVIGSALRVLVIGWIVIPPLPFTFGAGLDGSWAVGLNLAHSARLNFGRDVVFTYGPLGYLVVPMFPEAEPWAVFCFDWGMAILTGYALWRLCRGYRHWTAVWWSLGVFGFSTLLVLGSSDRLVGTLIALALAVAIRLDEGPWFDAGLLAGFAAVALLVKFNIGILGTGLAFYFLALLLWRNRAAVRGNVVRIAAALLVWPVTLAGLYWIVEGTARTLPQFFQNSLEVARGYSEAMAIPGPYWVGALAGACCIALWVLVPTLANQRQRVVYAVPPMIIVGFLCFKSAMVRQDAHVIPFPFEIAMTSLMVLAVADSARNRVLVGAFSLASMILGALVLAQLWPGSLSASASRMYASGVLTEIDGFWRWPATVKAAQTATERALAIDQLPADLLEKLDGRTVAVYPWEIAMIRANHLRWRPLPVFQAYSAYTRKLDDLNADMLADSAGPQDILLAWQSIDGRQPLFETPHSWRALLDWYDFQAVSGRLAVLTRRSSPRFSPPAPIASAAVPWGQMIELPPVADDELIVMNAEVRETLPGLLKRELLRSPVERVEVRFRSGLVDTRRVLPSNMNNGVIVSAWPRNLDDLVPMLRGERRLLGDRVIALRFLTTSPGDFNRSITIHWSRLKLAPL